MSSGLLAMSATSSAQVGAQQLTFPILPPSPVLLSIFNKGLISTLYKSALSVPHCLTPFSILNIVFDIWLFHLVQDAAFWYKLFIISIDCFEIPI